MKLSIAAFVAGLLLLSPAARAQVKPGDNQATINLGLANPLSDDAENGDTETFGKLGPAFGFGYLHQFQKNLSFGGDFSYKSLGTRDVSTGHGPLEIKSSMWTLLAVARADLMPDNNIRPYATVGLGLGGAKIERDYGRAPSLSSERTSSGPAFALAAGADYDINPTWLAGAELRYSIISTSESEIGTGHVSTFDVLLKVGYKF
jgi:opacity protein-like surface antigen